MDGLALRCRTGEQRNGRRDRDHRDNVETMHVLAELPDCDHEQKDETCAEQRLDESERRTGEREGLQRPAGQAHPSAGEPAAARDEAAKQGKTQRLRRRSHTGFNRLQRDSDRVERGGSEGSDRSRQDARHDRYPP